MKNLRTFLATIEKEGNNYMTLCPVMDIASQGDMVEESKANLYEAVELFFEHAPDSEIEHRLQADIFITNMQIEVEQA